MAKDACRPVIFVEPHIIESRGVLGPNHCAGSIRYGVGEVCPGLDDADPGRVKLGACFVGEPRQQAVVGRMLRVAEPEERLAARECIAVEQELLPWPFPAGLAGEGKGCAVPGTPADAAHPCDSARSRRAAPSGSGTEESSSLMRPFISTKSASCSAARIGERAVAIFVLGLE